MATPTQKVTQNAQRFLGEEHDVVLAVRVEWGVDATEFAKSRGFFFWASVNTPFLGPILAMIRSPKRSTKGRNDAVAGIGILALTPSGGRLLLEATRFLRKSPMRLVEELPSGAPLEVNVDLMETWLVAGMTVGDREMVVNGVDFRALLKAVEAGTVEAPAIAKNLSRLKGVTGGRYSPW